MKAIVVSETGGPDRLEYTDVPDPVPGPGEVLVDVKAVGVNYVDTYHREGRYPMPMPFTPGQEGAGVVAALGEGVTGFTAGQSVAWTQTLGSYAEKVAVPADRLLPVPDGLDPALVAASLLQGLTAHYLSHSTYPVQPGDVAVVHAAAGGVGQILTQLVKLRGGRVIATVSTEEKAKLAREAGADEVVGYEGFAEKVRAFSGGAGAHVVYDGVGRTTFDEGLTALRPRGMMALYGGASGAVPPFDPIRLSKSGSLFLTRPTMEHYVADREEMLGRVGDLLGWLADGTVTVRVSATYPLAEAARAHTDLEGRRTTGKILLIP
ncbi:quinone oxidoreductase [Actinorhabdospora filicis]|uniref:Quinone oxidoreductase n=1 Tax=Actinorhabdospora filicis TaxID=1785913 RepID=A0A9W6W269_9ACTN|nr:quinone oxidoreductase [Actinorhabdospora filicis]GLZ76687.1 quinone oxidoreductase [Actinorhabdospora filicis]